MVKTTCEGWLKRKNASNAEMLVFFLFLIVVGAFVLTLANDYNHLYDLKNEQKQFLSQEVCSIKGFGNHISTDLKYQYYGEIRGIIICSEGIVTIQAPRYVYD